jgi:alpha-galactosidase
MAPKITIVGGGSTHWGPRLLCDFANTPSLQDAEVVLVDIDAGSLPRVQTIAKHIVTSLEIGMQVSSTTELARGLEGADFVVTAFSVGGFESMAHDSVGPGGISRSLRSIGVLLGIAREVERTAPDALLLNVSNPLTALCRAVTSQTKVRTVGLCNELVGMQFWLSLVFDADMRAIDPVVAGVNHFPLVTSLRIGDKDGFAMLRDALADPGALEGPLWMQPPAQSHWHRTDPGREWSKADVLYNNRLKLALFERFDVMPGSADTHVSEFVPWFVQAASDQGRKWGVHHYGIEGHRADKADDDAWAAELEAGGELPEWGSGELVAPLIDAIVTGTERHLPVNLPNTGQVVGLPDGAVVECMGVIDGAGVRPRDTASPAGLTEHLRRVVAAQELTVQAALSEDRGQVLQAMLADPVAGALPWENLTAMTDELLARTSQWLPAGLRR